MVNFCVQINQHISHPSINMFLRKTRNLIKKLNGLKADFFYILGCKIRVCFHQVLHDVNVNDAGSCFLAGNSRKMVAKISKSTWFKDIGYRPYQTKYHIVAVFVFEI